MQVMHVRGVPPRQLLALEDSQVVEPVGVHLECFQQVMLEVLTPCNLSCPWNLWLLCCLWLFPSPWLLCPWQLEVSTAVQLLGSP